MHLDPLILLIFKLFCVGIVQMVVTGILAYRKGYSFWLWVCSHIIGLIWLAFLPFARSAQGPEEITVLTRKGNRIGGWLSMASIAVSFVLVIAFSSALASRPIGSRPPNKSSNEVHNNVRQAQTEAVYSALLQEVGATAQTNTKMQDLLKRFQSPRSRVTSEGLQQLATALLELARTDTDAQRIVNKFGISRNEKKQ